MKARTVLIVDDALVDRMIVENQIVSMGYAAYIANCGEDAIHLFQKYLPEIILIDLHMPGLGGARTIKRLRQIIKAQFLPIILVSGLIHDEDILQGLLAGADDYVQKPINYAFLRYKIKYFLDLKKRQESNPSLSSTISRDIDMQSTLREFSKLSGLEGFSTVYQPVVDLTTGSIIALEVLLRWKHPELGEIPPSLFIPIAERSGRMTELTKFVFERAAEFIKNISTLEVSLPLSINISAIELMSEDFSAEQVSLFVKSLGISSSDLMLEINETALRWKSKVITKNLIALESMGFMLTIDNATVEALELLELNIFHSFKTSKGFLGYAKYNASLCALNHSQKSKKNCYRSEFLSICKDIETIEDVKFIQELGYRFGQGSFFYKPLRGEEMIELLKS
jgi:EAL domain-containing protein (putative c-di-GMP-specific phosphodiesterase class I)/CheY-like chemotaxis protein